MRDEYIASRLSPASILGLTLCIILFISILLAGCPMYKVWHSKKSGEALLAEASYSRQIKVAEANAIFESSSLLARADTVRAHGIAASNQIIGESLKNNPSYLQWLFIDQLKDTKDQIIYVPSGAYGMPLPLPEAGRASIKQIPSILPDPSK